MESDERPRFFSPPPLRWLACVVSIIMFASALHIWTRRGLIELRGADLRLRIDQVQAYVDKMEREVRLLESGRGGSSLLHDASLNAALGAPQASGSGTFIAPPSGGLRTFSHSVQPRHHANAVAATRSGSSIDIVAEAFSNSSSRETFLARAAEGSGSSSGGGVSTKRAAAGAAARAGGGTLLEQTLAEMPDEDTRRWHTQLTRKLRCAQSHRGGIFLYHVRKAAGTSVKDVLAHASQLWRVPLYETEGLSLDPRFLVPQSLLSVLSIRDPVDRVLSMYWYEHVGWYDGILKQPERCKTLSQWVAAWRDRSDWKSKFISANPRSVYVEIENYYIKMLIGWTGAEAVGERELEQAKVVLQHFDVVLVMEWMQDARQIDAMNALFPGRSVVAAKHMIRGDAKAKKRLEHKLGADLPAVRAIITEINRLDLLLWEFAQSLLARRLRIVQLVASEAHKLGQFADDHSAHVQCGAHSHSVQGRLDKDLASQLGIHRPPGHKGPF